MRIGFISPRALVEFGAFLFIELGGSELGVTDKVKEFCSFGRVFSGKAPGFGDEVKECPNFFILFIERFKL